jgi:glycosyltransferase involved in cell wall biosynthesis
MVGRGRSAEARDRQVSVILPVYNEEGNLEELHRKLVGVLDRLGRPYEVLFVDDGSTDSSSRELSAIAAADPHVRVVQLATNFGQTAAMAAGIDHSRGSVLVTLDSDMQNDPEDIPELLSKIDEGYDVVSGWRRDRRDGALLRVVPSRLANRLISWASGLALHDYGCTLKAYRRWPFESLHLYGEMHRFLPAYAHMRGARVAELVVRHHPRVRGTSKYGLSRTFKVLLDLTTLVFLKGYGTKPIYVFGGIGMACLAAGVLIGLFVIFRWLVLGGQWVSPLLFIAIHLTGLATQFLLLGLVAEMIVRTYHESQRRTTYEVRAVIEGGDAGGTGTDTGTDTGAGTGTGTADPSPEGRIGPACGGPS